jgi:hypothetical protein
VSTAAAREHIEVVETWFNGAPSFKDDGIVYIPNPDPIRYVGDPRKHREIDENWAKLIGGTKCRPINAYLGHCELTLQAVIFASRKRRPLKHLAMIIEITGITRPADM